MLGPLPGMPFPYLLDLANLTHCSKFSSYSTSSEEPPLDSWAVSKVPVSHTHPHTHTHTLSLSLSLTHTHTHTHTHTDLNLKGGHLRVGSQPPQHGVGAQDR